MNLHNFNTCIFFIFAFLSLAPSHSKQLVDFAFPSPTCVCVCVAAFPFPISSTTCVRRGSDAHKRSCPAFDKSSAC